MTLPSLTKLLLKAKKEKNLSFEDLGNLINRDEVWVASLFYGQATASEEEATSLIAALDLASDLKEDLSTCLLYTSPSPRDVEESRMPSSA